MNDFIKKHNELITRLIGVGVIVLGLLVLFVARGPVKTKSTHNQVQKLLSQVYTDSSFQRLKNDCQQEDVINLVNKSQSLKDTNYHEEYLVGQTAGQKYYAHQQLSQIYQNLDLELKQGLDINNYHFREEIDPSNIHLSFDKIDWVQTDQVTDLYNQLTQSANHAPEIFQEIKADLDNLNKTSFDETDPLSTLNLINQIAGKLELIDHHPQANSLLADYTSYLEGYRDQLIDYQTTHQLNRSSWQPLVENNYLKDLIQNTPLDPRPRIALTFDDGPDPKYTPQVLEILDQYEAKATFFMTGLSLINYPETARQVHDQGHTLANHSYDHANFSQLSDAGIVDQISRTNNLIKEITGEDPTMFRVPYGEAFQRTQALFPEMTSVLWNVDSEDWIHKNPQKIYQNVIQNLQEDSILLMHDIHQQSIEALPLIMEYLQQNNYRFVNPVDIINE